jgi:hypothetical protein
MPIDDRRLVTVPLGLLSGVGLDLMAAISAPYDQANAGRRRAARVAGEPGDEGREITDYLDRGIAQPLVILEVAADKSELRAELPQKKPISAATRSPSDPNGWSAPWNGMLSKAEQNESKVCFDASETAFAAEPAFSKTGAFRSETGAASTDHSW